MAWKDSKGNGGADWYHPKVGMARGKFLGTEETTKRKYQSEEMEDAFRWRFEVFDMTTREPVFYINEKDSQGNLLKDESGGFLPSKHVPEGTPGAMRAIADTVTTTATGKGAKVREHIVSLGGEKLPDVISGAEVAKRIEEMIGAEVLLTFSPEGRLSGFLPAGNI